MSSFPFFAFDNCIFRIQKDFEKYDPTFPKNLSKNTEHKCFGSSFSIIVRIIMIIIIMQRCLYFS